MVTTYMEFGLVNLALKVFDEMLEKNFVSYNMVLARFYRNEQGFEVIVHGTGAQYIFLGFFDV